MKRKKQKIIIVIIFALLIGLIIFFSIGIILIPIENIKNKISKQSKVTENENITTVDVTDLETGSNINHEHIFKTVSNSTEHWNECTICHEKENIKNHNFTTTWALGYEICGHDNPYTKTCSCGYSETGYKPCVWDGKSYRPHGGFVGYEEDKLVAEESSITHARKCIICERHIYYSYYMNKYGNGKLYTLTMGKEGDYAEYCTRADGNKLDCNHLGRCTKCANYTSVVHNNIFIDLKKGETLCRGCNTIFGKVTYENKMDNSTPPLNTITIKIENMNQYTIENFIDTGSPYKNEYEILTQELTSISNDKKSGIITIKAKLKSNIKIKKYLETFFRTSNINNRICGRNLYNS